MAKNKTVFYCTECGAQTLRWSGQCMQCGAWNTLEERVVNTKNSHSVNTSPDTRALRFSEVDVDATRRWPIGDREWDRTLGGGIVPGSLILLGGDPGVGKSTLILQVATTLAESHSVLYASGEESASQVLLRAQRLGIPTGNCYLLSMTDLEQVLAEAKRLETDILVIDSIQTMQMSDADGIVGSVSQVKECTQALLHFAKESGTAVIIIGHVTKEGNIAGPRLLEHMVDTVLYLEGEAGHPLRVLRAAKNRFGDTAESGVFSMQREGLSAVSDLSRMLLADRSEAQIGTVVFAGLEGIRPLLAEVQALTNPTAFGYAKRTAVGYDQNRLTVLLAVLAKHAGVGVAEQDVYVNVAGGLRITEPAIDLAVALAIFSVLYNSPVSPQTAAIGEVGLTGDVRRVPQIEKRLQELSKMGFQTVFLPAANYAALKEKPDHLQLVPLKHLRELRQRILK
ncbi:MAG: DNA repair protein RadA [Negativicoccus succinicivorans]|uniref:DNA repair protein RadA n=1 Tax=Negativicoccus succinicivorans TaxID=620903 RepID=UPI0026F1D858|nr:DNA repair protein RadA [Negativicoccus succinicivorans]MBS6028744.1 DNA repair protein RadA [Negativicoccus succinicivorans]